MGRQNSPPVHIFHVIFEYCDTLQLMWKIKDVTTVFWDHVFALPARFFPEL